MRPGRYPDDHPLERQARAQLQRPIIEPEAITSIDDLVGPLTPAPARRVVRYQQPARPQPRPRTPRRWG